VADHGKGKIPKATCSHGDPICRKRGKCHREEERPQPSPGSKGSNGSNGSNGSKAKVRPAKPDMNLVKLEATAKAE
jgi:hypothetical protein